LELTRFTRIVVTGRATCAGLGSTGLTDVGVIDAPTPSPSRFWNLEAQLRALDVIAVLGCRIDRGNSQAEDSLLLHNAAVSDSERFGRLQPVVIFGVSRASAAGQDVDLRFCENLQRARFRMQRDSIARELKFA
jgi:hypothetical protein